jgi:signal transduction histidine kinase
MSARWRPGMEGQMMRDAGLFSSSAILRIATAALTAGIFVGDLAAKLGIEVSTFYVVTVLLASRFCRRSGLWLVAAGCVGLTILGYLITHPGGPEAVGFANTLISIGVIVVTAVLVLKDQSSSYSLRRSESYLAEAQRLSHTGTIVFNATGPVYWSEESYRTWGLDPRQGLPALETVLQRIHPDDRDRIRKDAFDALSSKTRFAGEFRIALSDRVVKHVQAIGHPFLSVDREPEMVCTHIDVTERKRARTEHERLRQLESDLAHINRLNIIGELTASLAHEILHPIATARNNARVGMRYLEMNPPDLAEVKEALACIVRDADRAKEIVDRIRDHVKKAPPRRDPFELDEAIEEVLEMVRGAIEKKRVVVRAGLAKGLRVRGDRVQLQQVLMNLILNSVEAMSSVEGRPRELTISARHDQGGDILVAVEDSGPGIDAKHIERVFSPFYTTKAGGIGMGLSICRSIIVAHGGRLWAEANRSRGANLQFTLPAGVGGHEQSPCGTPESRAERRHRSRWSSSTGLLR